MNEFIRIERSPTITVDGNAVAVSSLPDAIKKEINIFDALRQESAEKQFQYELVNLALRQKNSDINNLLKQYYASLQPQPQVQSPQSQESVPATSDVAQTTPRRPSKAVRQAVKNATQSETK